MPKRRKLKHRRQQNDKSHKSSAQPVSLDQNNPSRFKTFISKFWKSILALSAILGLFIVFDIKEKIHEWVTPDEVRWDEENYVHGIHIPMSIASQYNELVFKFGTVRESVLLNSLRKDSMYKLAVLQPPLFNISFKLKNEYLFISSSFRDIKTEQIIGKMDFNHWETKNSGITHYHDGDDNMEIIDANGFVVFNMRYQYPNTIQINGYFIGDKFVNVATSQELFLGSKDNPDDKDSAIVNILKIKPINVYK
jgi:hypothetical protein